MVINTKSVFKQLHVIVICAAVKTGARLWSPVACRLSLPPRTVLNRPCSALIHSEDWDSICLCADCLTVEDNNKKKQLHAQFLKS